MGKKKKAGTTVKGSKALTLPTSLGGDDTTFQLALVAATRGIFVEDVSDTESVLNGIKDKSIFGLPVVQLLASKGVEVEDYEVWFEITPALLCPFSEAYVDALGVTIPQQTWADWGQGPNGSHAPKEVGGKWYRSNLEGASGRPLDASHWVSYVTSPKDGIKAVLSVKAFQAVQAANAPPQP